MGRCYRWKLSLNPSRSCGQCISICKRPAWPRSLYLLPTLRFSTSCRFDAIILGSKSGFSLSPIVSTTLPSPIPNSWIISWGVSYGGSPSPQVMAFNPKLIDFSMRVGPGSHELNPLFRSTLRRIATGRVFFATAPWKPCLVIRTSWPSPMKRPTFASTCPSDLRIIPMEEQ